MTLVYGSLLGLFPWWNVEIPVPVALGAVAVFGYIFGRRTRQLRMQLEASKHWRELRRARQVAGELERIARSLRTNLATHKTNISRFKERVSQVTGEPDEHTWNELNKEAQQVLGPTLELATQISHAYDEIRQQTNLLMSFAPLPTEPLTGMASRAAFDEQLDALFAQESRREIGFALAIIQIDHFHKLVEREGRLYADRLIQRFSRLMNEVVRETDLAAQYGEGDFVAGLPHTSLGGASVFAERLKELTERSLPLSLSVGIAKTVKRDSRPSLLARADQALQAARAEGGHRIFQHDGQCIRAADSQTDVAESLIGCGNAVG